MVGRLEGVAGTGDTGERSGSADRKGEHDSFDNKKLMTELNTHVQQSRSNSKAGRPEGQTLSKYIYLIIDFMHFLAGTEGFMRGFYFKHAAISKPYATQNTLLKFLECVVKGFQFKKGRPGFKRLMTSKEILAIIHGRNEVDGDWYEEYWSRLQAAHGTWSDS